MSQEMLWERKETELTWMLLDGNQQTILKKQELGGSWHILLSGGDWQFLVLCTWGMPPAALQSFMPSSESSTCSPSVAHLQSTAFL